MKENATKFHKEVIDAHSNNTIIARRKALQIIIRFHFCIWFLLNERIQKEINWFSRKLLVHILEHQNKEYETCNFLMKSLKLFTSLFYQIIWGFNGIERLPDRLLLMYPQSNFFIFVLKYIKFYFFAFHIYIVIWSSISIQRMNIQDMGKVQNYSPTVLISFCKSYHAILNYIAKYSP